MSLKTNKLREENPTKLLLARAAAHKGIVLDPVAAQRVAADLVMESMKVEQLVGIVNEQALETERLEKFADLLLHAIPLTKRKKTEDVARAQVWTAEVVNEARWLEEEEAPDA